ncbi:hypothetical protein [Archangium violaceum]|uniref:Uncharacterized protein n=1 Tax=Archangium violaceum Cb vi76 TaxID=1406225 RepID=A0A084SE50_9BACT|nr:hypothetical protein [Archangium violaceum]KFA86735.1 hypothetical protein Q664_52630 [Archangium violaceum Cb vi76]
MSGQAGAQLDSEYYGLFIGSGINVAYAIPPGDDGTAIGRYFREKSAPYERWLERARPALDEFFARLAAEQRIPLVPFSQRAEEIHGVIIEDLDSSVLDIGAEQHFRRYHRGQPCAVSLNGAGRLPDFQTLELRFLVSTRVRRSALEPVLQGVANILIQVRSGL